ncbi:MAG: type 1 glutamine amidotransferase domain-containing protein [Clostridium sp.]|uniref:type 1 glutamine amidotransferase domain-containing protein n=1 Tax=Clostridium sp. TaxID=1506 RepID=UPI0039ED7D9E
MEISDKSIILLAEDEFEDIELLYPLLRLREEGIRVTVVGTGNKDSYTGKHGYTIDIDENANTINSKEYDGIIVPGGWAPDRLRTNIYVKGIIKDLAKSNKVIGCICHGASVLVSANVIQGYKLTCVDSIIDDVINAGGDYTCEGNFVDRNIVSAKIPGNLPQFMSSILDYLNGESSSTDEVVKK